MVIVARDADRGAENAPSPAHLWAVCRLLDRHMGVPWLWPGELGTVTPEQKTIALGELDMRFRPPLESRQFRGGDLAWKRRHGVRYCRNVIT